MREWIQYEVPASLKRAREQLTSKWSASCCEKHWIKDSLAAHVGRRSVRPAAISGTFEDRSKRNSKVTSIGDLDETCRAVSENHRGIPKIMTSGDPRRTESQRFAFSLSHRVIIFNTIQTVTPWSGGLSRLSIGTYKNTVDDVDVQHSCECNKRVRCLSELWVQHN